MNKKTKTIAIGTAIAGMMGYIAGILTAPKSGSETRSTIRSARDSGMAEAEKQLKKLHTELNELLSEAEVQAKKVQSKATTIADKREAVEGEVISSATTARQKAREILSAIHDGSADDRDLDRAISQAGKAIKSIRSYLRK